MGFYESPASLGKIRRYFFIVIVIVIVIAIITSVVIAAIGIGLWREDTDGLVVVFFQTTIVISITEQRKSRFIATSIIVAVAVAIFITIFVIVIIRCSVAIRHKVEYRGRWSARYF